jgi:hypothetical protein
VPYDQAVVVPPADQTLSPDAPLPEAASPDAPLHLGAHHRKGRGAHTAAPRAVPSGSWLTALAFVVVALPFAYAALRLATAPSAHLTLPDDLALIDLHVRRALAWQQQLGVFDHNRWNHPGPAFFYLDSLAYRVLGSSARSLFVGATVLNGLAAAACVGVVRRRTTPTRALWAAVWIAALAAVLAAAGPSATTYSESVLGALVSPWNPMVVLFPLLLLLLLCAGAVDRSGPSLVGALLVGSFVVQTDISTTPLVAALVGAAVVTWAVTAVLDRRRRPSPAAPPVPDVASARATGGRRGVILTVAGLVALVLMWVPPLVQQFTGHPGNLTLIVRFFTAPHHGQSLTAALWSVAAAATVVVVGPSEVMTSILGGAPAHAALAVAVSLATLVVAAGAVVQGARTRNRFALGTGALTLLGAVAAVAAVTHVVGFVFGYLVLWAIVLPVGALVGVGTVPPPAGWAVALRTRTRSGIRVGLCIAAVAVGVVACVRVAAIPPLERAGDPRVAQLAALVAPRLVPGERVAVGDAGAGTADTQLIDTEEFIGLVDQLDRQGLQPRVNAFWKAQFGPGYLTDGSESRVVGLSTWTPASPSSTGYVGRVGDMAVTVTDRSGAAAPVTG